MNEKKCLDLREAIATAGRADLPAIASALWRAFGSGLIKEAEASELQAAIDARAVLPTPRARRIAPRRPRPNASLERRRRWAAAGRMPPKIASHFTLGEQAALAVVAVEVTKRGTCMLAIGAIAALAGVGETTVRGALRQAKVLGFVTVEERRLSRFRNETNVVRIVSREWAVWLRLGGGFGKPQGTITQEIQGQSAAALRAPRNRPRPSAGAPARVSERPRPGSSP